MDKIKVAIVDDEAEFIKDLERGLGILGYDVVKALTGASAIEAINKARPKVVLCDYKLDDMDGLQVIAQTKRLNPKTAYIIITAYYDESLVDSFKKAGADEVVYKPIQLAGLDEVIRRHLKDKGE